MKQHIAPSLLLAALFMTTPVMAADYTYAGMDLMLMDYEETNFPGSFSPKAVTIKLGMRSDTGIGGELRLGGGISDDSQTFLVNSPMFGLTPVNVSLEIGTLAGAYITGNLPVSSTLDFYGIAGLTALEAEAEASSIAGAISASTDGREFSYGAGLRFNTGGNTLINLEYMMLVDNSDVQISTLNMSAALKF